MLKTMVSSPRALFALVIASRRDPGPLSLILLTVKVAPEAEWDMTSIAPSSGSHAE
jgi:hypothetical protein